MPMSVVRDQPRLPFYMMGAGIDPLLEPAGIKWCTEYCVACLRPSGTAKHHVWCNGLKFSRRRTRTAMQGKAADAAAPTFAAHNGCISAPRRRHNSMAGEKCKHKSQTRIMAG